MAKAKTDLLGACRAGYHKAHATNPHLFSSPNFSAYTVGEHMAAFGLSTPVACWAGRGDKINVHTAANEYSATVHYPRSVGDIYVTIDR